MKQHNEIERLRAMDRALIREQAMEGGWYDRAKHQVHKSKKAYNRKEKHKGQYDVN